MRVFGEYVTTVTKFFFFKKKEYLFVGKKRGKKNLYLMIQIL